MIDPDTTETGLPAQGSEGYLGDSLSALHDAGLQPREKSMSTLRLVYAGLQTGANDQMTRVMRTKGRRQLVQAQGLGAMLGLFGGAFAALCGGLLTAAGWFAANDGARQWLSTTGSVLLLLTIPLIVLGACCMDWMEKGKPRPSLRPSLKVVRPAEDENQ